VRAATPPRDELAPPHSITSSARPSSGSGTSRPRALAAFMLLFSAVYYFGIVLIEPRDGGE